MSSSSNDYLNKLFGLDGRTALVTGGTRGIGQRMAVALASAGADIILVQRSSSTETKDKVTALGRQATIVECDLSDDKQVKSLARKVTGSKAEGGLEAIVDVVINCGGIQRRNPAENFTDEDWDAVLQVNLNAVFTLSRDFGKHMLEVRSTHPAVQDGSRGRGKIINVASLLSFQGGFTVPAYAAAKHGVLGLGKALSNEWASKGINVNSIAPGYIATEMNDALIANPVRSKQIMDRIPHQRWGSPDDFEGVVVFLASKASDYVSGDCIVVDGGWMGR